METYKRNKTRPKQLHIDLNTLLFFVPYWLVTVICIFLLLMLASLIYMFTPLTQNSLPAISRTIFILAELVIAFFVGKVSGSPGFLSGTIYGLGVTVPLLLIGLFTGSISLFSLEFILMLFTGILIGAFGSIVGKNSVSHNQRRRGYFRNN